MWSTLRRIGDQNPVILLSFVMLTTGLALPSVILPVRQALGLKTNQMTKTSPRSDAEVARARAAANWQG